jgi:hypothetical protein
VDEADRALRDAEDRTVDARRCLAAEARDQDGGVLGPLRGLHPLLRAHGGIAVLLAEGLDRRLPAPLRPVPFRHRIAMGDGAPARPSKSP